MSGFSTTNLEDCYSSQYYSFDTEGDYIEWQMTITQAEADILNGNVVNPYNTHDTHFSASSFYYGVRKSTNGPNANITWQVMINNHAHIQDDTPAYGGSENAFKTTDGSGFTTVTDWTGSGTRFWGELAGSSFVQTERPSRVYPRGLVGTTPGVNVWVAGTNTIRLIATYLRASDNVSLRQLHVDFVWFTFNFKFGVIPNAFIDASSNGVTTDLVTPSWFSGMTTGVGAEIVGVTDATCPNSTTFGVPGSNAWILKAPDITSSGHVETINGLEHFNITKVDDNHYTLTPTFPSAITGNIFWYDVDGFFQTPISGTSTNFTVHANNPSPGYTQAYIGSWWYGGDATHSWFTYSGNSLTKMEVRGFLVFDDTTLTNPTFHQITDVDASNIWEDSNNLDTTYLDLKTDGASLFSQYRDRVSLNPFSDSKIESYSISGGNGTRLDFFTVEDWCFGPNGSVYFFEKNNTNTIQRVRSGAFGGGSYPVVYDTLIDHPITAGNPSFGYNIAAIRVAQNGDIFIMYDVRITRTSPGFSIWTDHFFVDRIRNGSIIQTYNIGSAPNTLPGYGVGEKMELAGNTLYVLADLRSIPHFVIFVIDVETGTGTTTYAYSLDNGKTTDNFGNPWTMNWVNGIGLGSSRGPSVPATALSSKTQPIRHLK